MRAKFFAVLAASALFSGATAAQEVGVPVCDRFLNTYQSCVANKVPPSHAQQAQSTIEALRANFRKVAATPAGRAELESVCRDTASKIQAQAGALGCKW